MYCLVYTIATNQPAAGPPRTAAAAPATASSMTVDDVQISAAVSPAGDMMLAMSRALPL